MNAKIKKRWIAALRSGKYKQGQERLRDPKTNTFCCLGVLCNLHAQAHPQLAKKQKRKGVYFEEESFLPYEVREWAGLESEDGELKRVINLNEKRFNSLVQMNDEGITFQKIAEVIEKHF